MTPARFRAPCFALLLLSMLSMPAALAAGGSATTPALIPLPASLQMHEGAFSVNASTPVHAVGTRARAAADEFVRLAATRGLGLEVSDSSGGKGGIEFRLDPRAKGAGPESY